MKDIYIAVTTRHEDGNNFNPDNYYKRLSERNLGIIPLVSQNENCFNKLLEQSSGLLVTGGNDIDPGLYHQTTLPVCGKVNPEDDLIDVAAIKYALNCHMPVLGICRGIQVLNAVLGGTLYQDLPTQRPQSGQHWLLDSRYDGTQIVNIEKESWLARIMPVSQIKVNSTHHQAVCQCGTGVKVAAYCDDGVIEAIEYGDNVLGVQWHPERLTDQTDSHYIFDYFTQLCRRFSASR